MNKAVLSPLLAQHKKLLGQQTPVGRCKRAEQAVKRPSFQAHELKPQSILIPAETNQWCHSQGRPFDQSVEP